jgi:phage/plasmid-associated DNA primase
VRLYTYRFSDRLVIVEFPVTFVDLLEGEEPSARRQQRDCGLKKKMEENKAALLRWLVEGSVRWYAQGGIKRDAPERVKAFSRNYLVEQDLFASFLRDRCRVEEGARVRTVEFKDAYNDWLRADGQKIWSDKAISAAVRAKGFEKKNALVDGGVGQCFFGIVVKTDIAPSTAAN